MGGYDDDDDRYRDVDDDVEDEDEDDDDDDDASSRLGNRPRPNPFANPGSGANAPRSGLPGASSGSSSYSSRFGDSSSGSSSGGGLSSRLGAQGSGNNPSGGSPSGSSGTPQRFGGGTTPPSSSGGLSSRLPGSPGPSRDTGEQPSTSRFGSGSGSSPSSSSGGGGSTFGNRPSTPSGASGSSGGGGSTFGNRPSTPSGGGSGSRDTSEQPSTSRFGSGSGNNPSSPSGGSSFGGNRPSTPSGGGSSNNPSSPSGGSSFGGNRPSTPGGSGSGNNPSSPSGSSFGGNRPSTPGSPVRDSSPSGGSSSINRGDLGSRLGTSGSGSPSSSSSSSSSSGGFGAMRSPSSDADKKPDGKNEAPSRFGGSKPPDKPGDKKDAPAAGGIGARLGGLTSGITSRIGGDKADDKKPAGDGAGGIGAKLGGLTGGLTSRLGGGDKKDEPKKPGDKKDDGAAGVGAIGARLGGLTSGLTSRFGGGDKKDDAKKPDALKPGSPSSTTGGGVGASRFGGGGGSPAPTSASSARPSSTSNPMSSSSAAGARQSPLGGAKAATAAPAGKADAKGGGGSASLGARFSAFTQTLPLFGKKDAKAAKKPRASKVPEVRKGEGLSLDTKLDIAGVVLVFASMIIFFSALSPNQGELTGWLNAQVGQLLGWGALAFPTALLAVGVWLILRHFGDKAPEINIFRVIGILMLYLGLLVIFQFVESLNYTGDRVVLTLDDLARQVQISYEAYRTGGGLIGGQIYLLLVSNITEFGAFFTVLGWMFVGFMLFADLSASEVAIVVISISRSFTDAVKRQRQRRSARIVELQAQRAAAAAAAALVAPAPPQIAVTRPAVAELPAAAPTAALPAPAAPTPMAIPMPPLPQTEERSIPMRLGGRSEILRVDSAGRPTIAPGQPAGSPPMPVQPAASLGAEQPDTGDTTGIGSRLRGALPFGGKSADVPAADKPAAASSLAGRLFGNKSGDTAAAQPAASASPVADKPAAASSLAGRLFGNKSADQPATPAASAAPTPTAAAPTPAMPTPTAAMPTPSIRQSVEQPAARLGDLLRTSPTSTFDNRPAGSTPAAESGVSPFSRPSVPPSSTIPLSRPQDIDDEDEDEDDESMMDMTPARPKGEGPAPRPASPFGAPPNPFGQKSAETPAAAPAGGVADRMDRLNALRSGATSPTPPMPRPAEEEKSADDAQQAGVAARIRPFNFGEQSDKPVATASTMLVSSAPQTAPANGEAQRPPTYTPAGTPAVTAAPKISIPTGHPDTPPAPAPVAPAATLAGQQIRRQKREWKLPDYRTLLAIGSDQDFDREFLKERARVIEDTLQSFGAPGKVVEINTGPVITQFGVEPDYLMSRSGKKNRIKVSAIAALDKDLQLALGAKAIRIEAPVPGKGFVGVEVPNGEASLVSLRDVMDSDEFKKIDSPLAIALGQSVDGTPIAADLASMPHLLIAGTTGSGKSVCVNAIISSIVLLNSPDRVKFIMVDPKRVELTGYNGIPHLVAPVVVELERIVGVLKWVTREMDERYKKFSTAGARNIEDYNKHLPADAEMLPYIVVIIDELADLMMLAPDETERVITRIAALARATGIHLVIATQRPSVDVVTGLIKANFPARIAFAVAGSVDSRVILDQPGAERLLGRGDMLYMSGDSPAPIRLQGVYVSDIEINNMVRYWKQHGEEGGGMPVPQLILDKTIAGDSPPPLRSTGTMPQQPKPVAQQQAFWDRSGSAANDDNDDGYDDDVEDADGDGEDDMYDEAVDLIRKLNKASVSLLQRRLRIGYTRAARLIDLMEERGVVGPAESGSKPRDVLPAKD